MAIAKIEVWVERAMVAMMQARTLYIIGTALGERVSFACDFTDQRVLHVPTPSGYEYPKPGRGFVPDLRIEI